MTPPSPMPVSFDAPRHRAAAFGVLAAMLLAACGTDRLTQPPASDPATLYAQLTLDQRAITLSTVAPYDTLRITATPRNSLGAPLAGTPSVTYRSLNLQLLQVSPDGMLQAIGQGEGVQVVATLTLDGVTHTDTAIVNITTESAPPRVATFRLDVPPDSTTLPMSAGLADLVGYFLYGVTSYRPLSMVIADSAGQPIPGVAVSYRSSDSTIATVDAYGLLHGNLRPGKVAIVASATVYGVTRADSVVFSIGLPLTQAITITPATGAGALQFGPQRAVLATGGYVVWLNLSPRQADVVFDDSVKVLEDSVACWCGGGNIEAFGDSTGEFSFANIRTRHFTTPGTYNYRSRLTGATGAIIVTDSVAAPATLRLP